MLDGIAKAFTLGAIALVILGLFDVNSYYSKFGIPINDFLSPSEVILSFSQLNMYSFFDLIMFSSAVLLNVFISTSKSKGLDRINQENIGNIENSHYSKTNPKFIKLMLWDILLVFLFFINGILFFKTAAKLDHYDSRTIALVGYFLWIAFYRLFEMLLFLFFEIKDKYYFTKQQLPIAMSILLLLSLMTSIDYVNKVKYCLARKNITEYNVKLKYEDGSKISLLKSSVYIGATDDYFFFYNLKMNNTVVLPKSEAKWIEIKKNEKKLQRKKVKTKETKLMDKDTSTQKVEHN